MKLEPMFQVPRGNRSFMCRSTRLVCGLFVLTLLLTSCSLFDRGAEVADTEPTVAEVPPTASPTRIPPTSTPPRPPATATATKVPPTASPTQAPPTPTVVAKWIIGETGGDGVYIRRTPDMDDRIKAWPDGTEMVGAGPDVTEEDRVWRNVQDPDGNVGFVPAEYLLAAETPETTPTATTTPDAEPDEPTPAPDTPEVAYVVGNTGGSGVYIRRTLDAADRIKAWPDGTEMVVVGPDVTEDDVVWKNVRDPDGNEGFVPADYLVLSAAETTDAAEPGATSEVPTTTSTQGSPSRPPKDDSY